MVDLGHDKGTFLVGPWLCPTPSRTIQNEIIQKWQCSLQGQSSYNFWLEKQKRKRGRNGHFLGKHCFFFNTSLFLNFPIWSCHPKLSYRTGYLLPTRISSFSSDHQNQHSWILELHQKFSNYHGYFKSLTHSGSAAKLWTKYKQNEFGSDEWRGISLANTLFCVIGVDSAKNVRHGLGAPPTGAPKPPTLPAYSAHLHDEPVLATQHFFIIFGVNYGQSHLSLSSTRQAGPIFSQCKFFSTT